MKLSYYDDDSGKYWYAATDNGDHDAAGATVEAALAGLVLVLEQEVTS